MFKFFLKKKILSFGKKKKKSEPSEEQKKTADRKRNRRIIERYSIDFKHLTILSDQNILVIKDISPKGFSTALARSSFDRFLIDDVYDGRIRYLGETFDVRARVTWKARATMGFELIRPTRETVGFLSRLLKPIEIATSLKQVDSEFMTNTHESKLWYHGENDTDLYVWFSQNGDIVAWQMCLGDEFVEWQLSDGFRTGLLNHSVMDFASPMSEENSPQNINDRNVSDLKIQMALDIIMASQIPVRETLIKTLTERS